MATSKNFNASDFGRRFLGGFGDYLIDRNLLAENIKAYIINRTLAGLDFRDDTFKEYSDSYKAVRRSAGKQTSPPNLNFTGELLRSLKIVESSDGDIKIASKDSRGNVVNTYRFKAVFDDNVRTDKNGYPVISPTWGMVTNEVLAKFLIGGTKLDGKKRMPARNFLAITPKDLDHILMKTKDMEMIPQKTI